MALLTPSKRRNCHKEDQKLNWCPVVGRQRLPAVRNKHGLPPSRAGFALCVYCGVDRCLRGDMGGGCQVGNNSWESLEISVFCCRFFFGHGIIPPPRGLWIPLVLNSVSGKIAEMCLLLWDPLSVSIHHSRLYFSPIVFLPWAPLCSAQTAQTFRWSWVCSEIPATTC